MEWAEETITRLRELWSEGHSTAEIGRRLGVTKNAVVGKAHRLDLPARPSPIHREAGERRPPPPRASIPRRPSGPTLPPLGSTSLDGPARSVAAPRAAVSVRAGVVGASAPESSIAGLMPVLLPPRPAAAVSPRPAAPVSQRVALSPPARPSGRVITCCWPIGEPGTRSFRFCDAESLPGKPYCADHAQLAYVKVRERREDAA